MKITKTFDTLQEYNIIHNLFRKLFKGNYNTDVIIEKHSNNHYVFDFRKVNKSFRDKLKSDIFELYFILDKKSPRLNVQVYPLKPTNLLNEINSMLTKDTLYRVSPTKLDVIKVDVLEIFREGSFINTTSLLNGIYDTEKVSHKVELKKSYIIKKRKLEDKILEYQNKLDELNEKYKKL